MSKASDISKSLSDVIHQLCQRMAKITIFNAKVKYIFLRQILLIQQCTSAVKIHL